MRDFAGKTAVITGGGTGMGRELALQLVAEGCNVALCDVSAVNMAETRRLCEASRPPQGTRVMTHVADVSVEAQMLGFRDEVAAAMETDRIHLLFNNAGIAGGGSLFVDSRAAWDRTFNVCWGGVYFGVRAFLPMMVKAEEAHIVNTSSLNGFWASAGPTMAHSAYCAAKFAVKGFTEALITDLRLHAPHIKCSVVMPGHIGTSIIANSRKVQAGVETETLSADELEHARGRLVTMGSDPQTLTDEAIQAISDSAARAFLENAPMTAAQAARVILEGVRAERWRILVGEDARIADAEVRAAPEEAYEPAFIQRFGADFIRTTEVGKLL